MKNNPTDLIQALREGTVPPSLVRNMGTLGTEGQIQLIEARIMVVGLGGLGGHVLEYLTRLNVGHITGVDPDVFDESNLNRQLLSSRENLGRPKAVVARERVEAINPSVEFVGLQALHSEVPEDSFAQANLVFDCLDNIPDRRHLAEICTRHNVRLIHGAIAGWYGQAAVIEPGSDLFSRLYPEHITDGETLEKEVGTPSFTAALTASYMVSLGIKTLLHTGNPENEQVCFIDLLEDTISKTPF